MNVAWLRKELKVIAKETLVGRVPDISAFWDKALLQVEGDFLGTTSRVKYSNKY